MIEVSELTKDYVAQVRAIQHIELRALEKGYLQGIFADEGQRVAKGAKMFQIMPLIYQAEVQKANAEAEKAVNTAKSGLYKMQMDVFANDGNAFLRYTLSQNLNSSLRLRLFQSGPGTFWTNLGDKSLNLFAPMPGANR